MIIAQLDPTIPHSLTFDLNVSGTKEEPSDIRFVIEGMPDPTTGDTVQDVFTIICKAVRSKDAITVYIPRLLNVFRSGSYKSRLEVVLENRLFIPLSEEIEILEPVKVDVIKSTVKESVKPIEPEVTVTLSNVITDMLNQANKITEEPVQKIDDEKKTFELKPIDTSWKVTGFNGIKNPFK